jgi:hypothetical protein
MSLINLKLVEALISIRSVKRLQHEALEWNHEFVEEALASHDVSV